MADGEPNIHDHERRITRVEAFMDARLVTKEVFDIWAKHVLDRLDKGEDNDKWLMRFTIMALVGVILNIIVVALTQLGR